MKKWKKVLAVGMAAATVFGTTVCAWGAQQKTAYTFTPDAGKAVQISVGADAQTTLGALGAAKESKTLANCANGGNDLVYCYDNFDVYTLRTGKKKVIVQSVVLKNDQVATEEGVKLGQTPKDVKKAYPDAVEENGLYTVTLGNSRITIDCGPGNDKVVDIAYDFVEAGR